MDTRIIFDYLQRRRWLWGLVCTVTLALGFVNTDASSLLGIALLYLVIIPAGTELGKKGPVWLQQTLPVDEMVLVRTIWLLVVVLPVVMIGISLLPGLGFGLMTGISNLATANLLPFISFGFLLSSLFFISSATGSRWGKSKLLGLIVLATYAFVGYGLMKVITNTGLIWSTMSVRISLVAWVLTIVSYMLAPQILGEVRQRSVGQSLPSAAKTQNSYSLSTRDRVFATPHGRMLGLGLGLLGLVLCFNLFFGLQSKQVVWWDVFNKRAFMPVVLFLPMASFIGATSYLAGLRCMAGIPITRYRKTLILIGHPLIIATPFILFMITQTIISGLHPGGNLRFALLTLDSLMAAYVSLAICVRFGYWAGAISMGATVMLLNNWLMFYNISTQPVSLALEILIPVGVILILILWMHRALGRRTEVYRRDWLPEKLRGG